MNFLWGIIIGVAMAIIVYLIWLKSKKSETTAGAENAFVNPAVEVKQENLQKLEAFISQKSADEQITNDQVQDFLSVSDATAERYLQVLEKQGKIRQVSREGRGVYYLKV